MFCVRVASNQRQINTKNKKSEKYLITSIGVNLINPIFICCFLTNFRYEGSGHLYVRETRVLCVSVRLPVYLSVFLPFQLLKQMADYHENSYGY
jgi:hypothetical protein